MKFESQYLTEKFKNKDSIEGLENAVKELLRLKEEEIILDPDYPLIVNPVGVNNSVWFKYKGKKIEINKENKKFSGEIMDGKNKIGISEINAKAIYDKIEYIDEHAESVTHNGSLPPGVEE